MKKPVLLLAAAVALAGQLFNCSSTFADGIEDDTWERYYISDIIEYRKEKKAEIAEFCKDSGNYPSCFLMEEIKLREAYGYKYDAVWQIDQKYFTITAVNPLRGTARIHDTGKHNYEKEYDSYVTELYMYWIEDGKITPQLNYLTANTYTDQIRNGEPESGVHVLYSGSTKDGTPLFPTDEETRIQFLDGSNLMLSTEKQIYYTTVNNYGDQRSGFYNYSKCAFSEGLECKGAFYYKDDVYNYLFSPSEETAEDGELPLWTMPEPEIEPEKEPEPEVPEEPESEPVLRSWTIDELLKLSRLLSEEEQIRCGDDVECRWKVYDCHFMSDPELFQALEMLTENRFLVTAINPEQGTLRINYRNITPMMERFGDTKWSPELLKMVLYWDENFRDDPYTPAEDLESLGGSTHIIVSQDFSDLRTDVEFYGQEIEYKSVSGGFLDDANHRIYYNLFTDDGGYESWYIDYGACLKDGYKDGYECRLTINQYGEMLYSPYEVKTDTLHIEDLLESADIVEEKDTEEEDITEDEEPDRTEDEDLEHAEDGEPDCAAEVENMEDEELSSAPESPSEPRDSSDILKKAPDTGYNTTMPSANESENSDRNLADFPYWMVAVAISATFVVSFMTKPRQNQRFSKKVGKKS